MKKYKLLKEEYVDLPNGEKAYRIVALINFGDVHKGDKGGYLQKEENLSQTGNAWVYDNASVYDNARVSDNAWVSGDAMVSGDARVYDNARVYGNASISGDARVYGNAWVYGYARVSENAMVYGYARVSGDAMVSDRVINLIFKRYSVTVINDYISIGCQTHTYEEWKNFTDYQIAKMDGADGLVWWHNHKDIILKICENNFKEEANEKTK